MANSGSIPVPLVFLALLALAGCAGGSPGTGVLGAEQIRSTITASPLTRCGSVLLGQWRYTGHHNRDGTMSATVLAGERREQGDGVWRVTADGLYCRRWSNGWAGGREGCFRVTRANDTLTFDHVSGEAGESTSYVYRLDDACE